MRYASRPPVCLVFLVSLLSFVPFVREARAQTADAVGVRAQGMGGAFTAVADDATASWWNPAGLAGGAYLNALIEWGEHQDPSDDHTAAGDPQSAWRANVRTFAVAFPAAGLSYYRLRFSEIQPQPPIATPGADRQDVGAVQVRLRSMSLNQFGVTVGQSLGEHLVVGSTVKIENAGMAPGLATGASTLDAADALDVPGETHVDQDIGVMATLGRVRAGLTVRNLWQPEFNSGLVPFTLSRQARAGVAVTTGQRGVIGTATVAFDADLTTTPTVLGDERRVAGGAEVWMPSKTFGVRGGIGASTVGEHRTTFSGGASAALKKGIYFDGEFTGGTDRGRRGWSVGLRLTYP
jgi:hypothetical protein